MSGSEREGLAGPLELVALRLGHRELLATFRELAADGVEDRPAPDPLALRTLLAYLRQGVLPFARREERLLAGDPVAREEAALEHAFLEAEIDRLAVEAAPLLRARAGARPPPGAARAVRRSLHRLEAVLELHLARESERPVLAPPRG